MSEASQALAVELGAALPPEFLGLTEAELWHILEAFRRARANQVTALDQSTEESIKNLPIVLRGPVRAIVGF